MTDQPSLPIRYETRPTAIVYGDGEIHELVMAEPSPVMVGASNLWRRIKTTIKTGIVLSMVFGYPALMVKAHQIDDTPVALEVGLPWSAPEAGVSVTLIAREVRGTGWAADRADWRPQAQLVALPAWQSALASALSDHAALSASLAARGGVADPDLDMAARLLRPVADEPMEPRLTAAAEALSRYDGRKERDLAATVNGHGALAAELRLFADWAEASSIDLESRMGAAESWPASKDDVSSFYAAKARAHVAHEILNASARAEPKLMAQAALRAEVRRVQAHWRRAATQSPLFVYNGGDASFLLANHLTGMAFVMSEAATASRELADLLEDAHSEVYVAELSIGRDSTLP
ncbi:MAG: hypothetical protein AAFQ21_01470 [Pseudomonadota bacterium]